MKIEELDKKLELHRKWLNDETDGIRLNLRDAYLQYANLQDADLRGAYLQGAYLRGAYLRGADLRGAYLQGACLDFSVLPIWCGGLNFKIDEKQAKQLMYHAINLMQYSGIKIPKSHKSLYKWLSDSHVVTKHNLPVLKEFEGGK